MRGGMRREERNLIMGKQRGLSVGICFRAVTVVLTAWICCAPVGAFSEDRSIPLEVEGEGEEERFSLMLGLGAVSPEFILGHIVPDPDPVESCPELPGQPWCGQYESGAEVLLTPIPNEGYVFSHWTGDLSGSAVPGVVIMDADKHVTAEFVLSAEGEVEGEVERFELKLGLGAVSPEFILGQILPDPDPVELCPSLPGQPWCGLYESGAEVLLTPQPKEGYVFSHWTGNLSGSAVPGVVIMDADKHVTAEFTLAAEGEGELPGEGEPMEGETAEGETEGEADDDDCQCCGGGKAVAPRDAIQRMLGDYLLLGLSMLMLLSMAVAGKRS